jgi:hypothetical protein
MNLKSAVILLLFYGSFALAQTPVLYPENADIQRQLEKLEIETLIKAEKTKSIPSSVVVVPPSESVTVDDKAGYFSSVLTFEALRQAAFDVACKLNKFKTLENNEIVIVSGTPPVEYAELYKTTLASSERLNGQMCSFALAKITSDGVEVPQDVTPTADWSCQVSDGQQQTLLLSLAAIPGFIGFAAQLVSFANIERKIYGVATTVNSSAVVIAMQESLQSQRWTLKSLQFKKFKDDAENASGNTQNISDKLRQMIVNSSALAKKQVELNAKILTWTQEQNELSGNVSFEEEILKIITDKGDMKEITEHTKSVRDAKVKLAKIKSVLQSANAKALEMGAIQSSLATLINNLLSKGENNSSPSLLYQFALIELYNNVELGLEINLENNGGEMHTSDSIWTHAKISYLGGVTLSYRLVDFKNGSILKTGLVSKVMGETYKAKKLPSQFMANIEYPACPDQ